jgi:hypothetical protein
MFEAVEEMLDAQPQLRERSKTPEFPRSYLSALTRNAAVDHL